ncbi:MAG: ROK family protein [bacterium]|nr:ROK family protein [bacterium]
MIGIDIGGTKTAAALLDAALVDAAAFGAHALAHLAVQTNPTPPAAKPAALDGLLPGTPAYERALTDGRAALLDAVIGLCRALHALATQRGDVVRGIGIGSAGQIDPVNGQVIDANLNLVGWKGTPLAAAVRAATGLPALVDNDVRVMALAESSVGAARSFAHVLAITVGTGIGGALILNGRVWHGAHFSAGEIGYLYGKGGAPIESLYAGPAIERRFALAYPDYGALSLPQIAQRAADGDRTCADWIAAAARDLGESLVPALVLTDPEALVVGGGVPEIGALWWDAFTNAIHESPLRAVQHLPILPAALGSHAGVIGAGLLALQSLK